MSKKRETDELFSMKDSIEFDFDNDDNEELFVEPYQKYLDKLKLQGKLQGHNKSAKKK